MQTFVPRYFRLGIIFVPENGRYGPDDDVMRTLFDRKLLIGVLAEHIFRIEPRS
jgi:hypothetical protein